MNQHLADISNTYLDESIYQFGKVKKKTNESFFNALQSLKKLQTKKEVINKAKTLKISTINYVENVQKIPSKLTTQSNTTKAANSNNICFDGVSKEINVKNTNNSLTKINNQKINEKNKSRIIYVNKERAVFNAYEKSGTKSVFEFSEQSIEINRREAQHQANKHSTEIFNKDKIGRASQNSIDLKYFRFHNNSKSICSNNLNSMGLFTNININEICKTQLNPAKPIIQINPIPYLLDKEKKAYKSQSKERKDKNNTSKNLNSQSTKQNSNPYNNTHGNKSSTCFNTNKRNSSKSSNNKETIDNIKDFAQNYLCDLDQEVEIPIRKNPNIKYNSSIYKSNSCTTNSEEERDNSVEKKDRNFVSKIKLGTKLLTTKENSNHSSNDSEIYIEQEFNQLENDFDKFNLKFNSLYKPPRNIDNRNKKKTSEKKSSNNSNLRSENGFETFGNNIDFTSNLKSSNKKQDNQSKQNTSSKYKKDTLNAPCSRDSKLGEEISFISDNKERELNTDSKLKLNLLKIPDTTSEIKEINTYSNSESKDNDINKETDTINKKVTDYQNFRCKNRANLLSINYNNPFSSINFNCNSNNFTNSGNLKLKPEEISGIEKTYGTPKVSPSKYEESKYSPSNTKNKSFKNIRKNLNFMNMSLSYRTNESFFTQNSQYNNKSFIENKCKNTFIKSSSRKSSNIRSKNKLAESTQSKFINSNNFNVNTDDKVDMYSEISMEIMSSNTKRYKNDKSTNYNNKENDYIFNTPYANNIDGEKNTTDTKQTFNSCCDIDQRITNDDTEFEINEDDFLPCPVFDIEFVQNLIELDNDYHPNVDFFKKLINDSITKGVFSSEYEYFDIRAQILDWMMEVSEDFGFKRDTYHIAINYFDRYINCSKINIPQNSFRLLASTCLLVASKIEEIQIPRAEEYVNATDNEFSLEILMKTETELSQVSY